MADLGNRTNVNAAIDTLLDDLAPNNSIQPSDHNGLLKDILDTLANGLSVALRTGNTTSGQNLEITSGDSIQFDNSTFLGSLVSGTLTGAQTYTLPDKSGTVAMTSDVSNILTANGIVMTGTYSHDLAGNTLTMDGGVINVTNGGFGVLGSGNVTSDGINNVLFSFIGSSGHQTLIVRDDNDSVAIGTSAADLSSVFEISSTTKGFLKPRMTTTQRDAIATPLTGLEVFNTTTGQTEFYNGSAWVSSGGSSIYTTDASFTGNRLATLGGNYLRFTGGGGIGIGNHFGNTISLAIRPTNATDTCISVLKSSTDGVFRVEQDYICMMPQPGDVFGQVGTELVSIQSPTAIKGAGTTTGSILALYDNDTTPVKVFEVLDDSTIKTNGNAGFTGTGAYTNFTIENGLITSAT